MIVGGRRCDFDVDPRALQKLVDKIDRDLAFAIEVEHGASLDDVTNYSEVRSQIVSQLEALRDAPKLSASPLIYHLDVAAMYPNIILTNRLQPTAIVTREDCAACDFNSDANGCKRPMEWIWRGETLPTGAEVPNRIFETKVGGLTPKRKSVCLESFLLLLLGTLFFFFSQIVSKYRRPRKAKNSRERERPLESCRSRRAVCEKREAIFLSLEY